MHGLPVWTEHCPALQVSAPLQNWPSSHGPSSGVSTTHPDAGLQIEIAHSLIPSQNESSGVFTQVVPWQVSTVQSMPSSQEAE